jgi:hypothetical protein
MKLFRLIPIITESEKIRVAGQVQVANGIEHEVADGLIVIRISQAAGESRGLNSISPTLGV